MSTISDTAPHDPFAALRLAPFRNFCLARLLLTLALQMQALAVSWQIYAITNDPLSLGLIGLAEAFPAIGIALIGGYVADTFNRRRVVLTCLALSILGSVTLLGAVLTSATPHTGIFYSVIFLNGVARAFFVPAAFANISLLIPKRLYSNSSTWMTSAWQTGAVTGPLVGGFLYGLLSPAIVYGTAAALLTISFLLFSTIPNQTHGAVAAREPIIRSLSTGIHFVFAQPAICGVMILDLFAVLFGGATALLPIFAKEVLVVGPIGLGVLRGAPSVGAILMAFFLAFIPNRENAGRNLFISVFGFGICMLAFGLSQLFWLSTLMLLISGALDQVSVVIRTTIVQAMTPAEMRGRVSAVNSMFISSSNEIGAFESGLTARFFGTIPSVVFGACMTMLVVVVMGIKFPSLRHLRFDHEEARE